MAFEATGSTITTTITATVSGVVEFEVTAYEDDAYRAYPLTSIYTPECGATIGFEDLDSDCEPPNFGDIWEEYGYYSPGICISGYTAGCSLTYRDIKPGQTAYNCVPSGWDCSSYTYQGASLDSNGQEHSAPAMEIRWESSDLAFLETHPLTPDAVATDSSETDDIGSGSRTASGPQDTGELRPADSGSDGSGVPTGAAVGIAVGAAAFVAILCGVAFIWYRKRRQKREAPAAASSDSSSMEKTGGPVLYGGPPVMMPPPTHFAAAGAPTELVGTHYHTSHGAAELHGRDLLPELPPAEVDGASAGGTSPAEEASPGFQVPRRPVGGEAGASGTGT